MKRSRLLNCSHKIETAGTLTLALFLLALALAVFVPVTFANGAEMPVVNDATCWQCHPTYLSVNDSANSSTLVIGGQHPVTNCLNCHSATLSKLSAFQQCTWCHYDNIPAGGSKYMSPRHVTDGAYAFQNIPNRRHSMLALHQSTSSGCITCHAASLTEAHNGKTDKDGNPINCNTCHNPTYLGDEASTNGVLKILKTQSYQTSESQVWFTPPGRTTSRVYLDQFMATGDYAEIYALYNGWWGLVYRATGLQSKWVDLPAETTAIKTRMVAPSAVLTTDWGLDVTKVTLTPTTGNTLYQNIKTAIANKDTSCESCHGQVSHAHPVSVYDSNVNSNCSSCHATDKATKTTDLVKLHTDKGLTCDSCHANPQIKGTIIIEDGVMNIPACAACHNGTIAPTADSKHQSIDHTVTTYQTVSQVNCASCHATDPTTGATNLVKLHNNNCDQCHNNNSISGTIINNNGTVDPILTCNTCHNGAIAPTPESKHSSQHDPATGYGSYTYDSAVNCANCHTSLQLTSAHNSSVTCNTCHSSTVQAVKNVISNNLSNIAVKTPFTCADCHNNLPNKHTQKHAVTTFETTGDSDCTGCHSKELMKTHDPAKVNCNTCHGDTAPQAAKDTIAANISSVTATPQYTCKSCHPGPHPSLEHKVSNYEANSNVDCASCHATDQTKGGTDLAKLHNNNCSLCHSNPAINGTIINNNGVIDNIPTCSTCHNGTIAPAADTKHNYKHTANNYTTPTAWTSDASYGCVSCHAGKDVTTLHANCNVCHSSTASATVKSVIATNLSTNTARTGFDCTTCHSSIHNVQHQNANIACAKCHTKVASDLKTYSMSSHSTCTNCHRYMTFTDPGAQPVTFSLCQSYCHQGDSHFRNTTYISRGCAPCHIPTDKAITSGNPLWGHYFHGA